MEAHQIEQLLSRDDPGTDFSSIGSAELLGVLSNPRELVETLDRILADPEWFGQVERDSYHHALGFKKFVLYNSGEAGQLRLHYWDTESARNIEHIHGHRFTFASTVVTGRMITTLFQARADGSKYRQYREEAAEVAREWRFVEVAEENLASCAAFDMSAGDKYVLGSSNLHRAEVPRQVETVTLLVQGPIERQWSPIFVSSDSVEIPTSQEQVRFSSFELEQYLRHIQALVERNE